MNVEKCIRTGKLTALVSFLIGTVIFGLYLLTSAGELIFIGYGFIVIAGVVNMVILAIILIMAKKDNKNRKKLFSTSWLMVLNIPVMLIYCSIAIVLTSIMRVTFINATNEVLKDINIVGCKTKYIDKLEKGESKTIWIGITSDCYIDINYIVNGERKEESVASYITSGMGQKMKYHIGGQNYDMF
jgi:NADH:ubiquinone oxidoreductase subunit 6 (subunit J)